MTFQDQAEANRGGLRVSEEMLWETNPWESETEEGIARAACTTDGTKAIVHSTLQGGHNLERLFIVWERMEA